MDDAQFVSLNDALSNQYIIMKKLYAELEEEREASSSAATEALSMILRLQREKAAEKMEACQYKRMAEEKMQHAEECLSILKEVTQQKEMEITSLQCQLEAYRQKLSSLGIKVQDVFDNQSFIGSSVVPDSVRFRSLIRRNLSLPSLGSDQSCFEMELNNEDYPLLTQRRSIWREVLGKHNECESASMMGWHQAEEEAKIGNEVKTGSRNESTVQYAGAHDIYEVPESYKVRTTGEPCGKEFTAEMINLARKESADHIFRDGNLLNNGFMSKFHTPSKGYYLHHGRKLVLPPRGNCSSYLSGTNGDHKMGSGTCQIDFEQLKHRLKQLEDKHIVIQKDTERGKEQMKLFSEIFKQLNTIETHIKSSRRKDNTQEDSKVVAVIEAEFADESHPNLTFTVTT